MSYQELIGQLKFLWIAASSALAGRSLKNAAGDRRMPRIRRRAVSTGPILSPAAARSGLPLRFAE